ncbi:signal peptide, CUB and EGF-like domain-containing protein 2 isoform X1 [Tachysurus ichikawai]
MTFSSVIAERDDVTSGSEHNATSLAEVDKRVKRRLLMGKKSTAVEAAFLLAAPLHTSGLRANCEMAENPRFLTSDLSAVKSILVNVW